MFFIIRRLYFEIALRLLPKNVYLLYRFLELNSLLWNLKALLKFTGHIQLAAWHLKRFVYSLGWYGLRNHTLRWNITNTQYKIRNRYTHLTFCTSLKNCTFCSLGKKYPLISLYGKLFTFFIFFYEYFFYIVNTLKNLSNSKLKRLMLNLP